MSIHLPAGLAGLPVIQWGATQKIATSAVDAPAAALLSATIVRVVATTDTHIAFDAPATATDVLVVAKWPEYFILRQGVVIHALRDTADGALYITEAVER